MVHKGLLSSVLTLSLLRMQQLVAWAGMRKVSETGHHHLHPPPPPPPRLPQLILVILRKEVILHKVEETRIRKMSLVKETLKEEKQAMEGGIERRTQCAAQTTTSTTHQECQSRANVTSYTQPHSTAATGISEHNTHPPLLPQEHTGGEGMKRGNMRKLLILGDLRTILGNPLVAELATRTHITIRQLPHHHLAVWVPFPKQG